MKAVTLERWASQKAKSIFVGGGPSEQSIVNYILCTLSRWVLTDRFKMFNSSKCLQYINVVTSIEPLGQVNYHFCVQETYKITKEYNEWFQKNRKESMTSLSPPFLLSKVVTSFVFGSPVFSLAKGAPLPRTGPIPSVVSFGWKGIWRMRNQFWTKEMAIVQ